MISLALMAALALGPIEDHSACLSRAQTTAFSEQRDPSGLAEIIERDCSGTRANLLSYLPARLKPEVGDRSAYAQQMVTALEGAAIQGYAERIGY